MCASRDARRLVTSAACPCATRPSASAARRRMSSVLSSSALINSGSPAAISRSQRVQVSTTRHRKRRYQLSKTTISTIEKHHLRSARCRPRNQLLCHRQHAAPLDGPNAPQIRYRSSTSLQSHRARTSTLVVDIEMIFRRARTLEPSFILLRPYPAEVAVSVPPVTTALV
jgi:hypothetical protein